MGKLLPGNQAHGLAQLVGTQTAELLHVVAAGLIGLMGDLGTLAIAISRYIIARIRHQGLQMTGGGLGIDQRLLLQIHQGPALEEPQGVVA